MKQYIGALASLALACSLASAQSTTRVYSEPAIPPASVLDPLNLQVGWHVFLPSGQRHDGIAHVQILTVQDSPEKQLLVQMRSGTVVLIDAASGITLWQNLVGKSYVPNPPAGCNSKQIFVVSGVQLYALSRVTGRIQWEMSLPHAPSAAPVADEDRIYLATGTGRLLAYQFAPPELAGAVAMPAMERTSVMVPPSSISPVMQALGASKAAFGVSGQAVHSISAVSSAGQAIRSIGPTGSGSRVGVNEGRIPTQVWDYLAESRLELAPLVTSEFLLVGGYSGSFYAMNKFNGQTLYRFQAGPPLTADMGQHGETAYVASQDYNVYALDIIPGRIIWRFVGGGPILQRVVVNDQSVYTVPENAGLHRLDRITGTVIWVNTDAVRFVAANKKYAYAMDRNNNILILDVNNGRRMGLLQGTRDFHYPIANEFTDRIYLASHDGLLLCLHDKAYPQPLRLKTIEEEKPVAGYSDEKKKPKKPAPPPAKAAPPKKDTGAKSDPDDKD